MQEIEIIVDGKSFSAELYDNEAAHSFAAMLPLSLTMNELNGNEKYCYLSQPLPTAASTPSYINSGDLMLYGSDCLVLFYESFSSSYQYTPLGRVENAEGLSEAVGVDSVDIEFRYAEKS